ncbi:MAG TPA: thioesterase family protein [Rubrivivax sp.]|nr:thioesterase family protein [Rubrivivax sp.]
MTGTAGSPRSVPEQALVDAELVQIFQDRITFNQTLGLKIDSVRPGDVRGSLQMRPELVGHFAYGRLHGGVIASVLDAMGGLAAMVGIAERHPQDSAQQVLQRFARLGTIDLRVDFLRPGLGRHFVASAELTRLGGRVGSTQMRLVNDEGTLIATGAASYIVS